MFGRWNQRKLQTKTYSLDISFPPPYGVLVVYKDEFGSFSFNGEQVGRGKNRHLVLGVDKDTKEQDVDRIVPRLAEGLTTLQHEFVIVRVLGTETIPEQERLSAIQQLRELGYQPSTISGGGGIRLEKIADRPNPSREAIARFSPQFMRLVRQAGGTRPLLRVLAKSKLAAPNFI